MYPRFAKQRVDEALSDTRVVFISGPRQSGKTTLAKEFTADSFPFLSLDVATVRRSAIDDPVGFVRGLDCAVIDEIQRAPDLLLEIKNAVDHDNRPGRFLLTGSANIMTIPKVTESLAGRIEIINLFPLSQAEIFGSHPHFIDRAFAGGKPVCDQAITGESLITIVLSGGYPEALKRKKWARKQDWYHNYLESIIARDIRDIAQIEQIAMMHQLMTVLGEHSGRLVNYSSIGSALNLNHVTTRKYVHILESLFLIEAVPPWFSRRLKRTTKSPKLHFLDTGLLSALQNLSTDRVKSNKTVFGPILESFALCELRKLTSLSEQRCSFFHFRDKEKKEVDIILENRQGDIVGIEVKASATVNSNDFSGLRKLAEAAGKKFIQGLVLYDHDQVVPFAKNMFAAPISSLWSNG
ncbi:MAG: ATP-binding protein [Aestuariivita sp.]|nr:ATP-binding protein [Aestuariivita sp.]MCY4202323.1 ATP-binding protein [Aestuariivita sp.]MCY4346767.1 ATP-binding protein [Aestuariivita sp.]